MLNLFLLPFLCSFLFLGKIFQINAGSPNGHVSAPGQRNMNSPKNLSAANFPAKKNTGFEEFRLKWLNNRWNSNYRGISLANAADGLQVTHGDPNNSQIFSIRSDVSIPQPLVALKNLPIYFEAKIQTKAKQKFFCAIGLTDSKMPTAGGLLGKMGIKHIAIKSPKVLLNSGQNAHFERQIEKQIQENFVNGDFVGVGIAFLSEGLMPLFFATLNGKLLGYFHLPPSFGAKEELFPFITLYEAGDSFIANFGKQNWKYNPNKFAAEFKANAH